MKAISILQPWASAIELGLKRVETRSWGTRYRGLLAIHAGARKSGEQWDLFAWARAFHPDFDRAFADQGVKTFRALPFGKILCICELTECWPAETARYTVSNIERDLGNFSDGRYAWVLRPVRWLRPLIAAPGRPGLWNWDCPARLLAGLGVAETSVE